MASAREPRHPLEKRDLLHGDPVKTDRADAVARQLLADGRIAEAIDYIEVTHTPELVAEVEKQAIATGSPFLLAQVARIRGETVAPELWKQVADVAGADDRWMDAVRALAQGGFEDESEALRIDKCPEYQPFKPLNK